MVDNQPCFSSQHRFEQAIQRPQVWPHVVGSSFTVSAHSSLNDPDECDGWKDKRIGVARNQNIPARLSLQAIQLAGTVTAAMIVRPVMMAPQQHERGG